MIANLVKNIVVNVARKEIAKKITRVKNEIIPLKKYVEEPNENNVAINNIKDDIIFIKNKLKQLDNKKSRAKNKKWYDE